MAQLQLKNYLERHKIGSLFEDLMARLIHDQPEDPLTFIRNAIQRKLEQRDGPQAAATSLNQTLPAGAISRSGSSASDTEKAKRSSSLSKTQPVPSPSGPRQASAVSGKPPTHTLSAANLDELFAGTRSTKADLAAAKSMSVAASRAAPASVQLDISDEALAKWAPKQTGPINIGYYGPVKRNKKGEDNELPIAKPNEVRKPKEITPDNVAELKLQHKMKKDVHLKNGNSKAELAKMLADIEAQERATQAQLRTLQAQAMQPHRDDADELSEDEEALAKEGVVIRPSGDTDKKKKKKKDKKKENAQVRFSVCRLCAKILEPQDESSSVQPSSRVIWNGQSLPSTARAPLLNIPSLNQSAVLPQAVAQTASSPSVVSVDNRTQLEILQDLRMSLGLTHEDIASGRVSPYWKSLHSDVSDVEESSATSRLSSRPTTRPAPAATRGSTTSSTTRRGPRISQEFLNQ